MNLFVWWIALGAAATAAGLLMQWAGLPGGWLVGPLLAALAAGLTRPGHPKVPAWALWTAQAVIGMLLAGAFRPSVLPLIGAHWLMVLLIVAGTLGISLAAGWALGRFTPLDRETAALGTLPGGASGMIAMSISLGADTRLVALMQYTRVVLVVLSASLLARFVLHPGHHSSLASGLMRAVPHRSPSWLLFVLTPALAAAGVWVGRLLRLPAAALLGPLLVGLVAVGVGHQQPQWLPGMVPAAYLTVGIYVGLLFDQTSVREAARLLPYVVASTMTLMAACAGMGWALATATGTDALSGYLATTPGGTDSITVMAISSGADVTLILAVQMARLLTAVFAGPALAGHLKRLTASPPQGKTH